MMIEQVFKYKSEICNEDKMFDDVKSFLTELYIPVKLVYDIILVVSEGFTNALAHGNQFDPAKTIEIRLCANERYIVADIIDEGESEFSLPENHKLPDSTEEGGRGIELITSLADEVILLRREEGTGNHLSVKFDLENYTCLENTKSK